VSVKKLAVPAVVATVVVLVSFEGCHELDHIGWIPHRAVTATYIGQNGWIPGEYRDCIAIPTRDGKLSPYVGVFGGYLACDAEGHGKEELSRVIPHHLRITFWGEIQRSQERRSQGESEWRWTCRLNEASVTCWAVN
jgi:hypothetical protein